MFICLFLTGGHYGMLQCVAWAGMLWSYSEEGGLAQAAQDTFSGDKPCCLCEAIAEAKQGDPKSPEPMPLKGLEKLKNLQCVDVVRLKLPIGLDLPGPSHEAPADMTGLWDEAPMSPPPRVLS